MLKKSDIEAMLKHFPEEFEAEDFITSVCHIENPVFTKEQLAKIEAGVKDYLENGAIPFEEAIERIEKWQIERSRQRQVQ